MNKEKEIEKIFYSDGEEMVNHDYMNLNDCKSLVRRTRQEVLDEAVEKVEELELMADDMETGYWVSREQVLDILSKLRRKK